MTQVLIEPAAQPPPPLPELPTAKDERWSRITEFSIRWVAAIGGALLIFSVLLLTKGSNPLQVYADVWTSTFARQQSVEDIAIKMAPFILAALAVVVPARAGMANVGGEGQVIIGAVAACGVGLAVSDRFVGGLTILLMILASMAAGALWAGIAGLMRLFLKVNEAVSTLLLNYVALDVLLFLIYQPWRATPAGQPATRELNDVAKLPLINGTTVHVGILIALVAVVGVWIALTFTTWGFRLATVGGNAEAARRAGMPVAKLLLSALLVGGALAGLAGMVHFAGVEYKLRPGFGAQIGYTAFLASWLARHRPIPVVIACFVFAALTVAGDSLQLDAGLPAATSSILTGLILVAVLGVDEHEAEHVMSLVVDVLAGGVRGGTSIMYAGLGETVSERAGVINLGTEGCMLVGALAGYAVTAESGSPWIGAIGGMVAGGLLASLHALLVVFRKANQFASGLTLLFVALGVTSLYGSDYVGRPIHSFTAWDVPGLSNIPALGEIFFRSDPLVYVSFGTVPLIWFILFKTKAGLLVRTAGERSEALTVHGYSVNWIRSAAVVAGGALSGLGGAHLSIAYANAWFENMVVGRGFIAVALVIFASWNPIRVMGGAYLFGAALALAPALQARGYGVNQFALDVIPFLLTLLVLAVLGKRTLAAAPEELKRIFENAPAKT